MFGTRLDFIIPNAFSEERIIHKAKIHQKAVYARIQHASKDYATTKTEHDQFEQMLKEPFRVTLMCDHADNLC